MEREIMQGKVITLYIGSVALCHIDYNLVNMTQIYTQFYLQLIAADRAAICYRIIGIKEVAGRKVI
jgi:hypothetical protein